ncbi:CBS domain-containing protein [Flavobacterium luminosum]|uniref:Acetoin utilization protein acuB n=1 Tax=Flavobacterium luminosum TaxID=2949086 RepID=A0ABT0TMH0_9FLAO|nr:CBS domain-containing protein [Flavobacterium sp. HXWNR70]MCL9808078.1 acetoin utilization protein acuB [Flavobacterium sp. HXWNR70]
MNTLLDYINQDFKPFDSKETISQVQDFFADMNFSHFPVVEDGVFIGNIAAEDAETLDFDRNLSHYKYNFEGFFTRKNSVLLDVLDDFAKNETNIIPILDELNNYIGYYKLEDVVKVFNETPFLKEIGAIIIVEKGINDYSFSQIAQIVEGNRGRFLGAFVSNADREKVQITIKLGEGGINDIIQTFRRYEYEIISEHQEDEHLKTLKERSDYLDKYLNI